MKIAVIFPKDSEALFNIKSSKTFGGASVQLYNIVKALNGISDVETVSLISDCGELSFPDENKFTIEKTFKVKDNVAVKIIKFHKVLKRQKPDVIVQRGLSLFSCLLSLYCKLLKIKFVFMFAHDNETEGRYQRTGKKCFMFVLIIKFTSLLIVQSENQKNRMKANYKAESVVIRSGYEIKLRENEIKNRKYILWVGRLEPWKRAELFIKLAEDLKCYKFIMVAPHFRNENEYSKKINEAVLKHKNLRILPFVHYHKIRGYFDKALFYVNTSLKEGFPNTFIQSFASGVPVISLNVDPDNILQKHKCGYFCKNDYDIMLKKSLGLLSNKNKYLSMSRKANLYGYKHHNINNIVMELADIIKGLF